MLYPLKFKPIFKEKVWGGIKLKTKLNKPIKSDKTGESWEISGLEGNLSVLTNGKHSGKTIQEIIEEYKSDLLGNKIFKTFGYYFPLLIKFIDAGDDLSVQVHPDDKFARLNHSEKGKNEFWYIIDAEDKAKLILGVNKDITVPEFNKITKERKLKNVLNSFNVKNGDALYIPAGRIHAIMKGILLAEIQQSSDLTYRIYDWNRKDITGKYRELHTELAGKVADLKKNSDYFINYEKTKKDRIKLVSNQYFTVNYLTISNLIKKDYSKIDSFVIFMCISGDVDFIYNKIKYYVKKGETILLPACINEIKILSTEKSEMLEIYI